MGLLNKTNIKDINFGNKYGITKKDMIGDLKLFPLGVVVRMLEEQEAQGNKPDVTVFQKDNRKGKNNKGFDWGDTDDKFKFWENIIDYKKFDLFYIKYPEYKIYDRS